MGARIPRRLTRAVKSSTFEKRYLRRIYLDPDRAFVDGCFATTESGDRLLREDLAAPERERLARVLKEAKSNRGLLSIGRLAIPLVLVGGAIGLNLLLLDSLLERAGEELLETVFGAQVEIDALDARPLDATIRLGRLTVADAAAPMTNLFELGPAELAINVRGLIGGRLVIESLVTEGLEFGTARESSGALERRDRESSAGTDSGAGGEAIAGRLSAGGSAAIESLGLGGLDFGSIAIDPAAFVAERLESLAAPALADELIAEFEGEVAAWQVRVDSLSARADELTTTVTRVQSINVAALTTVPAITDAITVAQGATATVTALADDAQTLQNDIGQSVASVAAAPARIEAAIRDDYDAIIAQIPDLSLDPRALAAGVVEPFLVGALGDSYGTVMRVVAVAERLRGAFAERESGQSTERGAPRRGRLVSYGAMSLPQFAILEAEGRGSSAGAELLVGVRDLTSDPQALGRPVLIAFERTTPGERLVVDSAVELRPDVEPRASVEARYEGSLALDSAVLGGVGIESAGGALSVALDAELARDERFGGTTTIDIAQPVVGLAVGAPAVTTLIADVLNAEPALTADARWRLAPGGIEELVVTSSLGDALSRRVGELADEIRRDIEAQVRAELDQLLADQLARLASQTDALASLEGRSLEELAQAETWQALVDDQRAELEGRVAALRGEAEAAIRAEIEAAEAAARAAADAAAAAAQAEIDAAAEAAQREAEAAAAAAADEAARRAAEEAANRGIRLPGFGGR